jgi:hypothetical protein
MLVGPFSLGQTFFEDLKDKLTPFKDEIKAGLVSLVDQKVMDEAKKAVITAAVVGGAVGLVAGILISPAVRSLFGSKK